MSVPDKIEGGAPSALDAQLLSAYGLLGAGVFASNGAFSMLALLLVLLAFAGVIAAALRPPKWVDGRVALGVLCAAGAGLALSRPPPVSPSVGAAGLVAYFVFTLGVVAVALWALRARVGGRGALLLLLVVYAAAGATQIWLVPSPAIDVHWLQQAGARALFSGRNPYQMEIPNLYAAEESVAFFGDQRTVLPHYPYPPLSLLFTAPGWLLFGDVRYTLLLGQLTGAFLLTRLARRRYPPEVALGLAALWLLHPRGLFVLEQGWTEPLVAAAWFLLLLVGDRGAGPWWTSLFFGMKQYAILAPTLLRPRLLIGLGMAAAMAIPFLLWSPHDFIDDVLWYQLRQPFRVDALSLPALVYRLGGWRLPGALSLVGWAAVLVFLRARGSASRSPYAMPVAAAAAYFAFFLFAKQAFCNYYYFVGALIVGALAYRSEASEPNAPPAA